MLSAFVKGYSGQRRSFFEDHIEPLQVRLIEIHRDYLKGFEAADAMLRQVGPSQELIDFLLERRRDLAIERQMSKDLATELDKVEKAIIRGEAKEALRSYCHSIISYFRSAVRPSRMSWYTDYIDELKFRVSLASEFHSESRWGTSEGFTNDPRRDLQRDIASILNVELPDAFAKVSESYAQMRRLFL
jgi:hypothetical protein